MMTSNQIAYWVNEEKKRSNLAMERENLRHNLEQEKIGRSQAAASYLGAQASMYNAQTNAANLEELRRHNLASESTNQYSATTGRFSSVANALLGAGELGVKSYDSDTRRLQYELEEDFQPYRKIESATKSVKNVVGSSLVDLLGGNKHE